MKFCCYPKSILSFFFMLSFFSVLQLHAQSSTASDSVVKAMLQESTLSGSGSSGTELLLDKKYEQANSFFTDEIEKDGGNKAAYFNRGVVNWATSKPENACRDWSSLLALGDTAAFKLLDKNCHGNMIIDEDTIPKKVYHKVFAHPKDDRSLSSNTSALSMADQMPQFPGGDKGLVEYLREHIKYPETAKQKSIQGTTYVSFVVSKSGKILYPYVARGFNESCDKEALRLVKSMPAWQAGKLNGKPVLVRYAIPVRFAIK